MPESSIEIRVSHAPDGSTKVDFGGFLGPGCFAVGDDLRARLAKRGIRLSEVEVTRKPEADAVVDVVTGIDQQHTIRQEG